MTDTIMRTKSFKIDIRDLNTISIYYKGYRQWKQLSEKELEMLYGAILPLIDVSSITQEMIDDVNENNKIYGDFIIEENYGKITKLVLFDVRVEEIISSLTFHPLQTVTLKSQRKFPIRFGANIYYAEYGRLNIIAGVSGAGKTHNAIINSQLLLSMKSFDKVLYIAKELGNEVLRQRFEVALGSTTDPHPDLDVVALPLKVNEKMLLKTLISYAELNKGKKILYVLDNGTNFGLDTEDAAKTGLALLSVEIHEWLVESGIHSVLWLTQVNRNTIRDLFTVDKKTGDVTFQMTLGDLKSSSALQELADCVIGIAKYEHNYYDKVLKGGAPAYVRKATMVK